MPHVVDVWIVFMAEEIIVAAETIEFDGKHSCAL